jgi:hypothetical protein
MTEQTIDVVSGDVEVTPSRSDAVPTAATEGARIGETQFRVVRRDKSLAERLEDAYRDDVLGPEEKELLDRAANQFGRRLSDEE